MNIKSIVSNTVAAGLIALGSYYAYNDLRTRDAAYRQTWREGYEAAQAAQWKTVRVDNVPAFLEKTYGIPMYHDGRGADGWKTGVLHSIMDSNRPLLEPELHSRDRYFDRTDVFSSNELQLPDVEGRLRRAAGTQRNKGER